MPTYLRWIAAITSGITAQFAFFMLIGAIAVGTDNTELTGGIGLLVAFGQTIVSLLAGLGVNDWLARRYPKDRAPERAADPTRVPGSVSD